MYCYIVVGDGYGDRLYVGNKFELLVRLFKLKSRQFNDFTTRIFKISPSYSHQHHCCPNYTSWNFEFDNIILSSDFNTQLNSWSAVSCSHSCSSSSSSPSSSPSWNMDYNLQTLIPGNNTCTVDITSLKKRSHVLVANRQIFAFFYKKWR